jgi:DNA-directed RNA polymerase subunit RPC12/RpoP
MPDKKKPESVRLWPSEDSDIPKMIDGAGQNVSLSQAAKAVKAFVGLWRTDRFGCGPQDYDFMVQECIEDSELLDEVEDQINRPEIIKHRKEPTVSLAKAKEQLTSDAAVRCPYCGQLTKIAATVLLDSISMSRQKCQSCGKEFSIVDDSPRPSARPKEMTFGPKPC